MNSTLMIPAVIIISLILYVAVILWINKWLRKKQTACFWRALFLAVFLAPGLLLYGEHAGIPLPSFAWMSGLSNAYNCMENGVFCELKLNLFISVLPFLATWLFVYIMCKPPAR